MIRPAIAVVVAAAVLATSIGVAEARNIRIPTSLASDSEAAGPMVPGFKASILGGPIEKPKVRKAKAIDPLKVTRQRMIAGKDVSDKDLKKLADSGDHLGEYYFAKRLEETGAEQLPAAARYYIAALDGGRDAAQRPVIRLVESGVLTDAELLGKSKDLLETRAASGDADARSALIRMYRTGQPFGLDPKRADGLLIAAADAGDSQAALDLAVSLLSGRPTAEATERAKTYLLIAAASETLGIRTMAENLLRGLEPAQVTLVSETVQ